MTPERTAELVERWVRLYTRGLARPTAERRREELRADLHDQIAHERAVGVPDRRIARRVASRMLRGAAADVAWRRHQVSRIRSTRPPEEEPSMKTPTLATSATRVAAFVAVGLAIPLVGTAAGDEVDWGVFDFVLAGVMLGVIGICASIAARRSGNLLLAGGVAVAGALAAVAGELDDAPGLVLLGLLMMAGGATMAQRRLRRTH